MSKLGFRYSKEVIDLIDAKEYGDLLESSKLPLDARLFLKKFLKEYYTRPTTEDLEVHPKEMITELNETASIRRRGHHSSKVPNLKPTTPNNFSRYGSMDDYAKSVTSVTPEDILIAMEEYEEVRKAS